MVEKRGFVRSCDWYSAKYRRFGTIPAESTKIQGGERMLYIPSGIHNPIQEVDIDELVDSTTEMLKDFRRYDEHGKIGNSQLHPPANYDAYEEGAALTNAVNNLEFTNNNVDIKSSGGEGGLV